MIKLIMRTWHDRRLFFLVYTALSVLMLLMYVAIFPSLKAQMTSYDQIMKTMPQALLKAMGVDQLGFNSLEGFLSIEYFGMLWMIIAILFSISFAGRSIAGEIENRTMSILLSLPISRIKLYWTKYFTGLAMVEIFTAISILSVIPLAEIFKISFTPSHFLLM